MPSPRIVAAACVGAVAALAGGCGGGPREKAVYKVRGRVTFEGKPVSNAVVTFHAADPNDRATPAHATADEDGRYVLHTYRSDDGAPAGNYIVTVYWPGPKPKADANTVSPDADGPMPTVDRLKNQYNLVGNSKLRATVEPKDNEINFDLPVR